MVNRANLDRCNVIAIAVYNGERSLRERAQELSKCIAKKIKRGQPVFRDVLANSQAVRRLVRDAVKWETRCGEDKPWWDKDYVEEARYVVAEDILSDACEYV